MTPTRDKILTAATELFAGRGYFGVSMQDVAGALGVSKAALYYYFPGKEQLFLAVVEQVFADLWNKISAAARRSRNPAEALIRVLETYLSFTLERPEAVLLRQPSRTGFERQIPQTLISLNRKLIKFFEDLFREASLDEAGQHQALREVWETLTLFFGRPSPLVKKHQVKKAVAILLKMLKYHL